MAGVDIMNPPQIMARGINEVQMQVSDKITLVLGSLDPSDPAAILTTNISVGPTLTMQLLARTGSNLTVEASGRLEEFHGYAEKTDVPRPKFSVSAMGTRAELNTNEVLVLGGPMQMNVVKTVDRMAYLSDIPAIGKLFTKVQVRTNFVRTMVILRPRVL
jgi:type II secretory pathway component GspD/PulD (secretin)